MLGLLFRGVFLIGILTWYSTSVWKLIDSYFRDQFRSYLEEEYRKNPRMKSDVHGASVGKTDPVAATLPPEATVEPSRDLDELSVANVDAVVAAENDPAIVEPERKEEMTGGTSENEGETTDKNAFLATVAESELESRKSSDGEQESRRPVNHDDRDLEQEKRNDERPSVSTVSKRPRKRARYDKRAGSRDMSRDKRAPRSRKVRTITLTEEDFVSAANNDVSDDDFWEFEEDATEKERLEGILVSELPFKPKLDLGDLKRVTADEYCPLTLEDEATCGDTYTWP
ncbi:uncharacterized protein LOC128876998 [Hylaeus volcanicus]|uniref:uncharacterized protein LOC128876998 n=1 Tax=Hylaeus volcanicus TaxID=313075 RepID=UPI0023B7B80D|nr:uncharacterized protein LOC128876998 [Hylaeus volcanicus]